MSSHVTGFQSSFRVLYHFVLAKLASASIRLDARFDHAPLPMATVTVKKNIVLVVYVK